MLSTVHLPRLSLHDPAETSEGSLDPLGLGAIASELAEQLVPGFTERTARPRMLAALAVGAFVLNRYPEGTYGEHREGSASIAYERLLVEAYAQRGSRSEAGYRGIPGIGKARAAADAGVRLKRAVYLQSPEAAGLWVAYKALAVAVGILDEEGRLLGPGMDLLAAWESGTAQSGLLSAHSSASEDQLRRFDDALAPLLGGTDPAARQPQQIWKLIVDDLSPHEITREEVRVVKRLLYDGSARRREIFDLVRGASRRLRSPLEASTSELFAALPRASAGLACVIRAIRSYENLASLLTEAWTLIRLVGASSGDGRVDPARIQKHKTAGRRFASLPGELGSALLDVRRRFEGLSNASEAARTLEWIGGEATRSPKALFRAMLERHRLVQDDKPPEGKRPWIEGDAGHFFVRTRYFAEEPWARGAWVHSYRLHSVLSFLREFGGAR